jgi:fumarate hydratase subunit alpha
VKPESTIVHEETFHEIICAIAKQAAVNLSEDALKMLQRARDRESFSAARGVLEAMLANAEIAKENETSLCQSPGYPVVYLSLGRGFVLNGFDPQQVAGHAISDVTRRGYLRPSIVHPLSRENTKDNSGANVPDVEITVAPEEELLEVVISFKGCGAELFSRAAVLPPHRIGPSASGIKRFVLETVAGAGGGPCPPVVLGVGIGGQLHQAAKLARRAMGIRRWDDVNPDPELAELEAELAQGVNGLGLGPAGIGGDTTCLGVKIGMAYTHTAIVPIVVNFHCWPARRARARMGHSGKVTYHGW